MSSFMFCLWLAVAILLGLNSASAPDAEQRIKTFFVVTLVSLFSLYFTAAILCGIGMFLLGRV